MAEGESPYRRIVSQPLNKSQFVSDLFEQLFVRRPEVALAQFGEREICGVVDSRELKLASDFPSPFSLLC